MADIFNKNSKNIIRFTLVTLLLIGIGFAGQVYVRNIKQSMAQRYKTEIKLIKSREGQKVETLKQNVLDRLKSCESKDFALEDAPIILDANGEMSIGLFMFQRDTVIYYWEKFYGEQISRKKAVEIAISGEARDLAEKIIFEETGGIFNWKNCARKESLVGEITVIKKLQ
ncbi:MAG TPA: hypothetical protein ENI63_02065 [Candidatus Kaiserbacteria bacterium]|nr:hypothetical protein [Candidatus Kaiserbacteria bacterium]